MPRSPGMVKNSRHVLCCYSCFIQILNLAPWVGTLWVKYVVQMALHIEVSRNFVLLMFIIQQ